MKTVATNVGDFYLMGESVSEEDSGYEEDEDTPEEAVYFCNKDGKTVFMPSLNAQSLEGEQWDGAMLTWKTSTRNAALCNVLNEVMSRNRTRNPRVAIIDSAECTSSAYVSLTLSNTYGGGVGAELVPISFGATWDAGYYNGDDGLVYVNPFSSTFDAYSINGAFDGVFLDACGCAVNLLGDIAGWDTEDGKHVGALECLNQKGGVFGITWLNSRHYCTAEGIKNSAHMSDRAKDLILGQGGYGAFVRSNGNDEIRHFEWMIGFMEFCAKREGFKLIMRYSVLETGPLVKVPKRKKQAPMRTVIFEAVPSRVNVSKEENHMMSQSEAMTKFWCNVDPSILLANDGILLKDYLPSVIADGKNYVKSHKELEALEQLLLLSDSSDSKSRKRERVEVEEKDFVPKSDFIIITGTPGYTSKLHRGGTDNMCTGLAIYKGRTGKDLTFQVPRDTGHLDKCGFCFSKSDNRGTSSSTTRKRGREDDESGAPESDYIMVTGTSGYRSKLHLGGTEQMCGGVAAYMTRSGKEVSLKVPHNPDSFDKCGICFRKQHRHKE